MFGVVDVSVAAISLICGIGAVATLAVASRGKAPTRSNNQDTAKSRKMEKVRNTGRNMGHKPIVTQVSEAELVSAERAYAQALEQHKILHEREMRQAEQAMQQYR